MDILFQTWGLPKTLADKFTGALVLTLVLEIIADKKTWVSNTNFNNSDNWRPTRVPQETDVIQFHSELSVEIMLPSTISACGIILPYSGEILIAADSYIALSGLECDLSKRVTFEGDKILPWVDPRGWQSKMSNAATPHAFQLPCIFDDVIFPPEATFSIKLPDVPISIKSITINEQNLHTMELYSYMILSEIGLRQFNYDSSWEGQIIVTGEDCYDRTGCSCGTERLMKMHCHMLSSELCTVPKCLEAIKPIGHCCKICGVVLLYTYDKTKFRLAELRLVLDSFVTKIKSEKEVELLYFAGKLETDVIEIVLTENGDYEGTVSEVVSELRSIISEDVKLGLTYGHVISAGIPFDPLNTVSGFKIVLYTFLAAAFVIMCILIYWSDIDLNAFNTSVFSSFARFENQTGDVELRYEVQPRLRKSFHNPLFDTTNSKAESKLEETLPSSSSEPIPDTSKSENEEDPNFVEMAEIPLEKPLSDSNAEYS